MSDVEFDPNADALFATEPTHNIAHDAGSGSVDTAAIDAASVDTASVDTGAGDLASGDSAVASSASGDVWSMLVGQNDAARLLRGASVQPVHAYLLVGPRGAGALPLARSFSAAVLCEVGDGCGQCRNCRLVAAGAHPDVRLVQRAGAAISAEQADEVVRLASLSPVESDRQILILDEFHLVRPEAAAKLLKTIEEPNPSTIFVVLADQVTSDLVTIASRCVRVNVLAITEATIAAALVADGFDVEAAELAAIHAHGDVERARLLAVDPSMRARLEAFSSIPERINGTGAAVAKIVDEVVALVDGASSTLVSSHELEVAALEERIAASGERGSGRKQLEERHKREIRRHRTDEMRSGLLAVANQYRLRLVAGGTSRDVVAVERIGRTIEMLDRNPNEVLMLQALLLDLGA
jgi:DNA polymerase III subunit delta'